MPVLVTGATGRVGSRFVPRLLDQEVEVRILARDAERASALQGRGAELLVGDLRDQATFWLNATGRRLPFVGLWQGARAPRIPRRLPRSTRLSGNSR